ncbi:uncharacterized protein [Channa argus]|uniref:uncharacterized protein n=1 Tax=Channa argus TaxID=215402 RepID=UPI0035204BB1
MSPEILSNFYSCVIESVLTNCITVWYGSTTAMDRKHLQRGVKTAQKITRTPLPSLQRIYHCRVHRRAASIYKDPSHLQHGVFTLLPSGRRYKRTIGLVISFSYHCYADDTQLFLSFPPDDSTVSSRISACLSDISAWMSDRHLQLNLSKTEVLVFPARPLMQHNISINIGSTVIVPTNLKNLGVIIDDQLSFKDHISSVFRACRFGLYNTRKIRPYITEYTTQLIVQALVTSRLDYCNALLMGLPISTIKPLQMIQNAAARLIFNQPKKTHVTPLFRSLHWLPVAARIRFKALSLAYRLVNSTAPAYLNSLIQVYKPSRPLRPANERRLVVPAPHRRHQAKLFSAMFPRWWNELPNAARSADSLPIFKKLLKTELFRIFLCT